MNSHKIYINFQDIMQVMVCFRLFNQNKNKFLLKFFEKIPYILI